MTSVRWSSVRLVRWEKRGLWVYYSLDRETLARAASYLDGLLSGRKALAGMGTG